MKSQIEKVSLETNEKIAHGRNILLTKEGIFSHNKTLNFYVQRLRNVTLFVYSEIFANISNSQ
jgi:hypothetical protein